MNKYFIRYGCYLGTDTQVIEADSYPEAIQYAYESAYQECESWLGSHGFGIDEEECEDLGIEHGSDEYWEAIHEYIEGEADYFAESYVPEKHDSELVL